MKKKILYLTCFIILFFACLNTSAKSKGIGILIPTGTKGNANTSIFEYTNFYNNYINEQEDTIIIESVKNISKRQQYISVKIGLFDPFGKNIGIINYCSKKDADGIQGKTINTDEIYNNLTINVRNEDIVETKTLFDIQNIAIIGDNESCENGSSLSQIGKTVDEILNRNQEKESNNDRETMIIIVIILGILILYLFICYTIDSLYRRGHEGDGNILCYIPIVNFFMLAFVALGPLLAIIYMIFLAITIYLSRNLLFNIISNFKDIKAYIELFKSKTVIPFIIVTGILFIIVIIKIIIKNYYFLYLDIKTISNSHKTKKERKKEIPNKKDEEQKSPEDEIINIDSNEVELLNIESSMQDRDSDQISSETHNTYKASHNSTINLVSQENEDEKAKSSLIDFESKIKDIDINETDNNNTFSEFVNPINNNYDVSDYYNKQSNINKTINNNNTNDIKDESNINKDINDNNSNDNNKQEEIKPLQDIILDKSETTSLSDRLFEDINDNNNLE